MNRKNNIAFFLSALFLTFAFSTSTLACSCIAAETVDIAFETSANIVVMKLRSIEKYTDGETGYGYGGIKQAKLTVEKVFKGKLKVGQVLTFTQGGGGDCVWIFGENPGTEYLFYLGESPAKPGLWVAGTCTRSNTIQHAHADILYLEKVGKVKEKNRLSGTLTQTITSAVENGLSSYELLAGRRVWITGNEKTIELKTDHRGVYEIYDLPPGKYLVKTEVIEGYKPNDMSKDRSISVELAKDGHEEVNFRFTIDNRIRGRFFDPGGRPMKDVCLRLRPAVGKESQNLFQMDCTDKEGTFEFDDIPTGTYVLVVNEEGKITSDEPFGTFYFPGTKKREEAASLNIGPGYFHDDLIINAPEAEPVITISGALKFENGIPANKSNSNYVSIEFFLDSNDRKTEPKNSERSEPDSREEIDENGRFQIKILKGQKGRLVASMSVFKGMFENCPRIDKFAKDGMPEIKSNEIQIEAVEEQVGIELRFPFPACKLASDEN